MYNYNQSVQLLLLLKVQPWGRWTDHQSVYWWSIILIIVVIQLPCTATTLSVVNRQPKYPLVPFYANCCCNSVTVYSYNPEGGEQTTKVCTGCQLYKLLL